MPNQNQPNNNDPIFTAIGSIASIFAIGKQQKLTAQQQKLAGEQQKLAEEQQKLLALQAQAQAQQAQIDAAARQQESDSLTEQIKAKMQAAKAYLVPISIAASVAIVALTFYYIKKKKK